MQGRPAAIAGLLGLYVVWGATYLAIRLAIETVPPLLMMGTRSIAAGALLYAIALRGGAGRPSRAQWRGALVVGSLFFVGCHGVLAMAQRAVPSGVAALLLATIPLWVPLLSWLQGSRPAARTLGTLAIGFAGVALLIGASRGYATDGLRPLPVIALLLSALSWAVGSVLSRVIALPRSVVQAAGMELLLGGAILLAAAALTGELAAFELADVSLRSLLGLGWLILFGSVLGFTLFAWLLRIAPPERVSTYAYVNPVIALGLGWWLLDEPTSRITLLASAIILAAVGLVLIERPRQPSRHLARAGNASPTP
jgi:drug/metabolite transporter (DMT)-like permease